MIFLILILKLLAVYLLFGLSFAELVRATDRTGVIERFDFDVKMALLVALAVFWPFFIVFFLVDNFGSIETRLAAEGWSREFWDGMETGTEAFFRRLEAWSRRRIAQGRLRSFRKFRATLGTYSEVTNRMLDEIENRIADGDLSDSFRARIEFAQGPPIEVEINLFGRGAR